jgi:moderate conductance mechanosensitive channel
MRLRFAVFVAGVLLAVFGSAHAAATAPVPPRTAFWVEQAITQIEAEVEADFAALPLIPGALDREWRSLDRAGSALGTLADLGWIALAALVSLVAEKATGRLMRRRLVRRMRQSETGPGMVALLGLVACDLGRLAVFLAVFSLLRHHLLVAAGVTTGFAILAFQVLLRWRVVALIVGAVLRPAEPEARLIEISDDEARRLHRFLSVAILLIIALIGFGRFGLALRDDTGAAHLVGLLNAVIVCGIYLWIVFRAREATEALIRGRRSRGFVAVARAGLARAWVPIAVILVAALLVFFVAGLSLGLLSYYHAVTSTLGIWFVVMVLDRLTERAWHDADPIASPRILAAAELQARTLHHILRAFGAGIAVVMLGWVWAGAVPSEAARVAMLRSTVSATGTLFIAFIAWELVRLAIDRHLYGTSIGPALPGAVDDDEAGAPASRLQTILPLVRAAFGVVIGVLAALIVLSRLGVDTAPLIAGAGVFGLAVSFGSQSLVRDIISGLFYMWDDAFRVGEYIDTGRLKGTVETLGIRSVKLRHQNGPLHTIPYGQLGAVTNLSRDFATIKFNLRFEPGTDIELVRKTAKQIGIAAQSDPEIAGEVMLPLKLQGIAEIADNAVVLRFKFTARPVKPSWVQREYLKRMVRAFADKGVKFASGAVMLHPVPLVSPPAEPAGATVAEAAAIVDLTETARAVPTAAG